MGEEVSNVDDVFGREYWRWILNRMHGKRHKMLFETLHDIMFRWVPEVDMDAARETDGRYLRRLFEDASGLEMPPEALTYPASFLEVLVALADSMEDSVMYDPGSDSDSSKWFWMMLDNMGIKDCDDRWFDETYDAHLYVRRRVDDVMLRRYSYNGHGGLFPLNDARKDMRTVDLWYQMNAYVIEKGWV